MRFKGLLVGAVLLFWLTLFANLVITPRSTGLVYVLGYIGAVFLAAFWSILNYIDNLRINPIYRPFSKVEDFIGALPVNSEEKQEIKQMMQDYVTDQVKNGERKEVAEKQIVKQFQDNKFQDESSFFYVHSYSYLFWFGLIWIVLSVLLFIFESLVTVMQVVFLMTFEVTFLCFGAGFLLTFLMYQLLNHILLNK